MRNIFIAATGQHIGKTTSTLGLMANLLQKGFNTGYCKPVGQKHITVDGKTADKDAVLFSKVINFNMEPEIHSPVILGKGITSDFIDNSEGYQFEERIRYANQVLNAAHDLIVFEGTGHPGVGSVVNLSNADVAKLLGTPVVMVVEGGIGSTIDKLNMSTALFRERQVPIIGVIVNKVKRDKYDKIQYYLSKKLKELNIPLLGVLPYDPVLSYPILATIKQAVSGKVLINEACLGNKVEDIVPGSLIESHEFTSFKNVLLIASYRHLGDAINRIKKVSEKHQLDRSPLSGVIVTGSDKYQNSLETNDFIINHPYFEEHQIPVLSTSLDTYGSVVKISRIEVKINTRTPWKAQRAIELIRENVDLDLLIEQLEINQTV